MGSQSQTSARSWIVVLTAGAFFFYSFIQMTLFSTEAMKAYFMALLGLNDPAGFGNFAATFLHRWRQSINARMPVPNPDFDPERAALLPDPPTIPPNLIRRSSP